MGSETEEGCDCNRCRIIRAKENTLFEVIGGVVHFSIKDDFYDEIDELIRLRNAIDMLNDRKIWEAIFAGNCPAFRELTESGKELLRGYEKILLSSTKKRKDPSKEVLCILHQLGQDNGECVGLINFLTRDIEDEEINFAFKHLKEFMRQEISEETVADTRERIEELLKIIPEELHNLKEAPSISVPAENLPGIIKNEIEIEKEMSSR